MSQPAITFCIASLTGVSFSLKADVEPVITLRRINRDTSPPRRPRHGFRFHRRRCGGYCRPAVMQTSRTRRTSASANSGDGTPSG